MTAFTPQAQVFIGGVDYADLVDYRIKTFTGRESITDQPQPGHTSIRLWSDWDKQLPINLNDSVEIKMDYSGITYTLFAGNVSDITVSIAAKGNVGNLIAYDLTVVDVLALLQRRVVGYAGYPEQKDGDRILAILEDALLTRWSEVQPTLTWQAVDPDTTWDTYDGINNALVNSLTTQIDTPGVYDLAEYADGPTTAGTLLEQAANSGRGVLYAGPDNTIWYDDYDAHLLSANWVWLTADQIEANGLTFDVTLGEIVNDVEVTYAGGSEFARDEQSVAMYGELSGTRSTVLLNGTAALSQAEAFLASRAYPRDYPNSVTVDLQNPDFTFAERQDLLDIQLGKLLILEGLPAVFKENFLGIIENYSWDLSRGSAVITIAGSEYTETYPATTWLQAGNSVTWATYNPATDWTEVN